MTSSLLRSRALALQRPAVLYPLSFRYTHAAGRAFSQTAIVKGGNSNHGEYYDPPSGWLFGVKPGEKREREGWEYPFFITMGMGWGILVIGYAFKPDTTIQTWALEEARRRLEREGILPDPDDVPKES